MSSQPPSPADTVLPEAASASQLGAQSSARNASNQSSIRRRRTQLACTVCRQRKTRCDGKRPTCSPCLTNSLPCEYEHVSLDDNSRRRYKSRAQLVQHIQALEHRLQVTTSNSIPQAREDHATIVHPISSNDVAFVTLPEPPSSADSEEDAGVDELATATFNQECETTTEYFGPSSNHALFSCVLEAFARLVSANASRNLASGARRLQSPQGLEIEKSIQWSGQSPRAVNMDIANWPSNTEAKALIDHFIVTVGTVLPILSKSTLYGHWNQLRSERLPRANQALLNIVFAHAAAAMSRHDSKAFYGKALASVDEYRLRSTSLELVQALLLICVFQQNHQISISSWTYHALTVKAALQLGLHAPTSYTECALQDGELRKRLWYAVVSQDRVLGMSLGRPLLIPPHYVKIQMPSDPHAIYRPGSMVDPNHVEGLTFHNRLILLNELVSSALHDLYSDNIPTELSETLEHVLTKRLPLYFQLQNWRQNNSLFCQVLTENDFERLSVAPSNFHRFQPTLSVHYYRALLLLNRPVLTTVLNKLFTERNPDRSFDQSEEHVFVLRTNFHASKMLLSTIRLISQQKDVYMDRNNAWWLCNFTICLHLFGTLLVIYSSERIPPVISVTIIEIRTYLDEALDVMKTIQRTSLMSCKARRCLVGFLEVFDSIVSEQQPTTSGLDNSQSFTNHTLDPLPLGVFGAGDYSHYVTQMATDFLAEFNQSNFISHNGDFLGGDLY